MNRYSRTECVIKTDRACGNKVCIVRKGCRSAGDIDIAVSTITETKKARRRDIAEIAIGDLKGTAGAVTHAHGSARRMGREGHATRGETCGNGRKKVAN